MSNEFLPKQNIQPLAVGAHDELVLDQRTVTVQSYETTIPFPLERLREGVGGAWLTPTMRFGLVHELSSLNSESLTVILGLQDALAVQAYDHEKRRPLWFSWSGVIVETISVHYFRGRNGLLRFTTTGGGRRITETMIREFSARHLGIPEETISKLRFDLAKIHHLCFGDFRERLYMLRFVGPSGKEYRSIDVASFKSREHLDPEADRFKEIESDGGVTIESFDSDAQIEHPAVETDLRVRFFLRGESGTFRVRFPKINYRLKPKTVPEQARVYYELVERAFRAVLPEDFYSNERRRLDELSSYCGLSADMVDLEDYRYTLAMPDTRRQFLFETDFRGDWESWQPHLRAINELIESDLIAEDLAGAVRELAITAPRRARDLIAAASGDPKARRVAGIAGSACWDILQQVPAYYRAALESSILDWALKQPGEAWRVNTAGSVIEVGRVRIKLDSLSLERTNHMLVRLLGALHEQLLAKAGDLAKLLEQLHWTTEFVAGLSHVRVGAGPAIRLIAAGGVPKSLSDDARVLPQPPRDFTELDRGLWEGFGVPAWPYFRVSRDSEGITITNEGLGIAEQVNAQLADGLFHEHEASDLSDLLPGSSLRFPLAQSAKSVAVRFHKFGALREVELPVEVGRSGTSEPPVHQARQIPKERLKKLRKLRNRIDPDGIVVGASQATLSMFREIAAANELEEPAQIMIMGETGVGKTHVAELIHRSGPRRDGPFLPVNAGGTGGDANIQRGEWVGFSPGHGVQGVEEKGKPGHFQRADGGTLFIDECDALSPELQTILLSIMEGRPIQTVGGESISPSVQCTLATNADLETSTGSQPLREDLLQRISSTIRIAPLRERPEDIVLLVERFGAGARIDNRVRLAMSRHDWRGNVRGLQKAIKLAIAQAKIDDSKSIKLEHCDFPESLISGVRDLSDSDCRRELFGLADSLARAEGYEADKGLQRRVGEILGLSDSQTSRMYAAFEPSGHV